MPTVAHLPVRPAPAAPILPPPPPATPDMTSAYAAFLTLYSLPPSWVRTFVDAGIADAMEAAPA